MGEDNEGEMMKGCQGTCIKDPWTKPKGGRESGGVKMETTVLNDNKK